VKRIVLVRPQGPRNVGSSARLIANFGPAELVVVRPERPSVLVHPAFAQMAHRAQDVEVVRAERLSDALADCTGSIGFSARARDHRTLRDWRDARDEIVRRSQDPGERLALVFGNEESGLSAEETEPLGELVRFPTSEEHTSLNLAMAVGIVLSAVFFADAPSAEAEGRTRLLGEERAFLVRHWVDVLGPLTTSAAARRDLTESIERVFARAPLETRDARAWHLLARALGSERTPRDYGLIPSESAADRGEAP
jgi:TrmH family RNA methyltransferase